MARLRERAERVAGPAPASAALRQRHELQVTQIELDMQSAALAEQQHRHDEARRELAGYETLYRQAPASYLTLDLRGRIARANLAAGALLGTTPEALQGKGFERYLAPERQAAWRRFLTALTREGGAASLDTALFDGIPGAGAVRIDANLDAGNGACRMLVTTTGAAAARPGAGALAVLGGALHVAGMALAGGEGTEAEAAHALRDAQDRLQRLAAHLAGSHEQERQRVAQQIHDDVAQNLLALRLDVVMLRARTSGRHAQLHRRAGEVLAVVDSTMRSARAIINSLRPPVLELGLDAAFEWLLGQFSTQAGVRSRLAVPDESLFAEIGQEPGLALFRMLQEALTNVRRHAGASVVVVGLYRDADGLAMSVEDDGVGIAPGRRLVGGGGLSLIAERLRMMNGELRLAEHAPGRGCALTIRLPASVLA
ncbi:PAS domain S-box-containing protein [Pseudoduganella namucuonensis]|uniref:Oxygen sensor histidine kinase NreB n=2 Tax=Pseudoduganella namucuonensis TaxID=1035707 RepID=A0A1I7JMG0_9BURK|nr:PAS domain S-box-containing protein [Pseudoduganella namucuonensis]